MERFAAADQGSFLRTALQVNCCIRCGESFSAARFALGYHTCLGCGDAAAVSARNSWCVVPMHKSNYVLVTDPDVLKQLNPKRGM